MGLTMLITQECVLEGVCVCGEGREGRREGPVVREGERESMTGCLDAYRFCSLALKLQCTLSLFQL
jgi:hypothetical protein